MPIRFFCVYCNTQLGIATRKAGSIVACPSCKKQLRVPTPEEDPESVDGPITPPPQPIPSVPKPAPMNPLASGQPAAAPPAAKLFEGDISKILNAPEPVRHQPPLAAIPRTETMGDDPKPVPMPMPRPNPVPMPPAAPQPMPTVRNGLIILTRGRVVVFVLIALFLMFLSFVGGVYFGKSLNDPPAATQAE